jgi:hypothetical protein
MKKIVLVLSFAFCINAFAQQKNNKSFQFEVGTSFNGSGDIKGYAINSEFNNYFKKKLSYSIGLGATVHDGEYSFYNGNNSYSKLNYTVGGLQASGKLGYSFIRTNKSDFGVRLGTILRFQSTSSDNIQNNYGIVYIDNYEPLRRFSIGAITDLYYNYNINQKLFIGICGTFQIDSNGDTIRQFFLTCGMRF